MGFYLVKRLLFIIPFSLFVVIFTLVLNQYFSISSIDFETLTNLNDYSNIKDIEKANCERRRNLHQDLPIFYISIQSSAIPKDIEEICLENERQFIKMLCLSNGNENGAMNLYYSIKQLELNNTEIDNNVLLNATSILEMKKAIKRLELEVMLSVPLSLFEDGADNLKTYIPVININGVENQFHYWLIYASKFDFGKSNVNNLPVVSLVNSALKRTLVFTLPTVFILFIVSIAIGILIGFSHKKRSSILMNFLFFIDAIPLFWLSILLIILGGSYFSITNNIIGIESSTNYFQQYFLPISALVIASMPYLSKQVYSSIRQVMNQPYIQTAKAKGVSSKDLILYHILPNAMIPIVVLFFNFLVFAFGGAFVVEIIFSISGIGKLMADSILSNDFQVSSLILLYLVLIKMTLMIFSDLLNYFINPNFKFT
jgi:peptide/nickel transport system permease protein